MNSDRGSHNSKNGNYDCTCPEPLAVTLFHGCNDDNEQKNIFIENLRTHGWSPIIVCDAPIPSPSHEAILDIFRRRKQCEQNNNTENNDGDVVFIAAESGSSEPTGPPRTPLLSPRGAAAASPYSGPANPPTSSSLFRCFAKRARR